MCTDQVFLAALQAFDQEQGGPRAQGSAQAQARAPQHLCQPPAVQKEHRALPAPAPLQPTSTACKRRLGLTPNLHATLPPPPPPPPAQASIPHVSHVMGVTVLKRTAHAATVCSTSELTCAPAPTSGPADPAPAMGAWKVKADWGATEVPAVVPLTASRGQTPHCPLVCTTASRVKSAVQVSMVINIAGRACMSGITHCNRC